MVVSFEVLFGVVVVVKGWTSWFDRLGLEGIDSRASKEVNGEERRIDFRRVSMLIFGALMVDFMFFETVSGC